MGVEVLTKILGWFNWVSGINTYSEVVALVGIILVSLVLMIYVGKGVISLGKWLVNLRVKEFTLMLALIGVVLIGIAILIP
ncbi:MAG: hypothetical protein LM560_04860 [Desulfurococcaceae archaeon]|nr:hypothetical protein [Desulfurococcaceae archaeon]